MSGYRVRHEHVVVEDRSRRDEPFDVLAAYPMPGEPTVPRGNRFDAVTRRVRAVNALEELRKGAEAVGEARARQQLAAELDHPDEPTVQAQDRGTPPPLVAVADDNRQTTIGDPDAWRRADYSDDPMQAVVASWRERGWRI